MSEQVVDVGVTNVKFFSKGLGGGGRGGGWLESQALPLRLFEPKLEAGLGWKDTATEFLTCGMFPSIFKLACFKN